MLLTLQYVEGFPFEDLSPIESNKLSIYLRKEVSRASTSHSSCLSFMPWETSRTWRTSPQRRHIYAYDWINIFIYESFQCVSLEIQSKLTSLGWIWGKRSQGRLSLTSNLYCVSFKIVFSEGSLYMCLTPFSPIEANKLRMSWRKRGLKGVYFSLVS